jgi:hypothetical protein
MLKLTLITTKEERGWNRHVTSARRNALRTGCVLRPDPSVYPTNTSILCCNGHASQQACLEPNPNLIMSAKKRKHAVDIKPTFSKLKGCPRLIHH